MDKPTLAQALWGGGKPNLWDALCAGITILLFIGIGVMLAWRG